jgi:hypothetical protein
MRLVEYGYSREFARNHDRASKARIDALIASKDSELTKQTKNRTHLENSIKLSDNYLARSRRAVKNGYMWVPERDKKTKLEIGKRKILWNETDHKILVENTKKFRVALRDKWINKNGHAKGTNTAEIISNHVRTYYPTASTIAEYVYSGDNDE